jgi:hypothetical protein
MQTGTLAAEMLQLSASTHAWHQRHHDGGTGDALLELRPAIETFVRGAAARDLDASRVRRLATTAIRIAVSPDDRGARAALVRDVEIMLDSLSPGRVAARAD